MSLLINHSPTIALAVFPVAEGPDEMMKIASRDESQRRSLFFSLTPNRRERRAEVFRRLRIFTPAREISFAAHPVAGTWNALAREGIVCCPEGETGC